MPKNANRRRVFRSAVFFRNEINFYTKILPMWQRFQEQHQVKQPPFLDYLPQCFATHCDGENDFIALEDLTPIGYRSFKRQGCISLEECLLILKVLGRFHGISLAFKTLQPEEFACSTNAIEVESSIDDC